MSRLQWVFLAYKLPREPSTPRIAVWRTLRRLGAVQVLDGLVALPLDARTREQFEWVADDVVAAGGESSIWIAEAATARIERQLAARMASTIAAEYTAIRDEARALRVGGDADRRAVARLRRDLQRVRARDFFPPAARDDATAEVDALVRDAERSLR